MIENGTYEPNGECPNCGYSSSFNVESVDLYGDFEYFEASIKAVCPSCDTTIVLYPQTTMVEVIGTDNDD